MKWILGSSYEKKIKELKVEKGLLIDAIGKEDSTRLQLQLASTLREIEAYYEKMDGLEDNY